MTVNQWDIFEPKEMKVGETYDLSQEAFIGGTKTRFQTAEPTSESRRRRNYFPGVDWRTILEPGAPYKFHPEREGAVCEEDQGRFIFTQPGRYIIIMENPRVDYTSYNPVSVSTSFIIVK